MELINHLKTYNMKKVETYQMNVFYVGSKMFVPNYEDGETGKECYERAQRYAKEQNNQ
jgi:hypothetical protein